MSKRKLPEVSEIRSRLRYEPETGDLFWLNGSSDGLRAGCVTSRGYVQIVLRKRSYMAHRIIWAIYYGVEPRGEIDHINGDCGDNRISNLRDVSHGENLKNSRIPKHNTSGHIGVLRFRNGWRAQISVGGKIRHLGCFDTMQEAIVARQDADRKFGFHSNHGRASI